MWAGSGSGIDVSFPTGSGARFVGPRTEWRKRGSSLKGLGKTPVLTEEFPFFVDLILAWAALDDEELLWVEPQGAMTVVHVG